MLVNILTFGWNDFKVRISYTNLKKKSENNLTTHVLTLQQTHNHVRPTQFFFLFCLYAILMTCFYLIIAVNKRTEMLLQIIFLKLNFKTTFLTYFFI